MWCDINAAIIYTKNGFSSVARITRKQLIKYRKVRLNILRRFTVVWPCGSCVLAQTENCMNFMSFFEWNLFGNRSNRWFVDRFILVYHLEWLNVCSETLSTRNASYWMNNCNYDKPNQTPSASIMWFGLQLKFAIVHWISCVDLSVRFSAETCALVMLYISFTNLLITLKSKKDAEWMKKILLWQWIQSREMKITSNTKEKK